MSGLGRRSALSALDAMDVDVLIAGGGISGCSAAQQLTASGYRVMVIDKGGGGGQVLLPLATVSSASTVVEEWRYAGGSDVNDVGASLGGIA